MYARVNACAVGGCPDMPNDAEPIGRCRVCHELIYEGDRYYDFDGELVQPECIERYFKDHLVENERR
jgi:hypothetical protein